MTESIIMIAAGTAGGIAVCVLQWRRLWSLRGVEPRDLDGQPALLWLAAFLGLFAVQQVFGVIGIVTAGVPSPVEGPVPLTLPQQAKAGAVAQVGIIVVLAGGVWWARRAVPKAGLVPGPGDLVPGLAAALLGIPLVVVSGVLALAAARLLGLADDNAIAHDLLAMIVDAPGDPWVWVLIGTAVVLAPITEELLYRGVLQSGLVGLTGHRWVGVVCASLVFTAIHLSVVPEGGRHALVQLFALGVVMGLAFERTKRIGVPILMHALFNAYNVALAIALGSG